MFHTYTEYVDSCNTIQQIEIQENIISHLIKFPDDLKIYIPEIVNQFKINFILFMLILNIPMNINWNKVNS